MAGPIEERTEVLGGVRTALRKTGGTGTPVVFVHGNPSSSFDWVPFLQQLEAPGIAFDLPGFGDSERPAGFDHSMQGYAEWIGTALDDLGLDRFSIVVHDWGGIALQPASERAERVERTVVINAVPLFGGYRWHWIARIWRSPAGAPFNATATKPVLKAVLRQARPGFRPMPAEWVDATWAAFDPAMRDAVLQLYRSADPEALAAAGARLHELRGDALVVWAGGDPYIEGEWGRHYAQVLAADLREPQGAGHWAWVDRPDIVRLVTRFLDS